MFKLFGGTKKNRGFYLELNENEESQPAAPEAAAAPEPAAVVEEQQRIAAPTAQTTSVKKSVTKAKPATVAEVSAPVAVSPSSTTTGNKSEPEVVNFATDYLVVQTMSRRLPGPSLKPFKEMASQMKTPKTKA